MGATVAKTKADLWAIARGPSISVPTLTLLRRGTEHLDAPRCRRYRQAESAPPSGRSAPPSGRARYLRPGRFLSPVWSSLSISWGNGIPLASHIFWKYEAGDRPGMVLISFTRIRPSVV
jgi:hypothetical protein